MSQQFDKNLNKELNRLIHDQKQAEPLSKLGFFSKPTVITDGDFAGKILKVYRSLKSQVKTQQLLADHQLYIEQLLSLGVSLPETEMYIAQSGSRLTPMILQERFEPETLVRHQLENAENIDGYLTAVTAMLSATVDFILAKSEKKLAIGFHPTTRNYASQNRQLVYFDTFPPMAGPQSEVNRYILQYSPIPNALRGLIPNSLLNIVSDEYYDDSKMILGIVGSACRLRPQDQHLILDHCRELINQSQLATSNTVKILETLSQPPRLPAIWTFVRRILGKPGAPNTPL